VLKQIFKALESLMDGNKRADLQIGVLVYPQIPWTLFAWLGGLVGNFLAKK
jgi:hypothetical protein